MPKPGSPKPQRKSAELRLVMRLLYAAGGGRVFRVLRACHAATAPRIYRRTGGYHPFPIAHRRDLPAATPQLRLEKSSIHPVLIRRDQARSQWAFPARTRGLPRAPKSTSTREHFHRNLATGIFRPHRGETSSHGKFSAGAGSSCPFPASDQN